MTYRVDLVCPGMTRLLVTFGTGDYTPAVELLRHTALDVGGFDRVLALNDTDVDCPVVGGRGHNSFSWKPLVIARALEDSKEGDVVVYADATMQFEKPLQHPSSPVTLFEIG
ncbi:MAG: hypothetical protein EOO40_10325, partial [Deltaproteobacteria bacterium]